MAHSATSRGHTSSRSTLTLPSLAARIVAAFAIWRQRRALAELPEHLRRDLGLTEADIRTELNRPVWHVPQFWRF
jgi:uncharacterized protein YjiS (DUF1127 family)